MLISSRHNSVFRTAARGLEAQRIALGASTENIANATTSRTADGTPYALKRAIHEAPEQGRFSDALNQARRQGLATSDSQHMAGFSLKRQLPDVELGPRTEVQEVVQLRAEYDPTHPHADAQGYVHYPDVNVVEEMARVVSANRIYEANLSTLQAAKEMIKRTIEI